MVSGQCLESWSGFFTSSRSLALSLRFAAASLWCARSVAFLCPKSNVGTQSILYLSQLLAALPETKCFSHTRSFSKISSVRSSRLIAEIQRDLLSLDSSCASSPWFVTTEGTLAKYNPLSRPLLLPQPTIMHKTMFHTKDATSLFTIEVHQYGGVATVVKVLVTWVKTIY